MLDITVTIDGLKGSMQAWDRIQSSIDGRTKNELSKMAEFARINMLQRVPRATNELADSIHVDKSLLDKGIVVVGPNPYLPQAEPQEFGFTPHYTRLDNIRQSQKVGRFVGGSWRNWPMDVPEMRYGLRYKKGLARVGRHHPYVRPTFERVRQVFYPNIKKIVDESVKIWKTFS